MKEAFIDRKFKDESIAIILQADRIIEEYAAQGFTLTLRQLYYQFVSRDIIPNSQNEYKRLGSIVNDARLAGLLDWDAIEDRTRNLKTHAFWDDPASIIDSALDAYKEDLWRNQPHRVEVWIEKDALVGVVEGVCERYRVPFFACRGYASQSELYSAGKRLAKYGRLRQHPIILHLGDHDPSGIDMTRDNQERLSMFSGTDVEVRRLALNWPQIEQYDPPPNPAKETDSRAAGYIERFGDSSWELDALSPTVISELIGNELDGIIEPDQWAEDVELETNNRSTMEKARDRWDEVEEFLGD